MEQKSNYPVIPLRIFGLSFLLAWLWAIVFQNPLFTLEIHQLFCLAMGSLLSLAVLALRQRITHYVKLSSTSFFVFSLATSVVTFIVFSIKTDETVILAFAVEICLWLVLGYSITTPLAQWLFLYMKWDIDKASFFTILSFALSTILCFLLTSFVPIIFIIACALLPLISFGLYKLCVQPDNLIAAPEESRYRDLFLPFKLQLPALFCYAATTGFIYCYSLLNDQIIQSWVSIVGIAIASLVAVAVLWLHHSRRRGLFIMEKLFVSCSIVSLAIFPFADPQIAAITVVLYQTGSAFLIMLVFIFLIDIGQTVKISEIKVSFIMLSLLIGGFGVGSFVYIACDTFIVFDSASVLITCMILILILLLIPGALTSRNTDWVVAAKKTLNEQSPVAETFEPIGLDILPEVSTSLSSAYVTQSSIQQPAYNDVRKTVWRDKCLNVAEQHCLSPRETDVFLLLAKGRSPDRIAEGLFISTHTVKSHINHIYEKLGIHSRQELLDLVENASPKNADILL